MSWIERWARVVPEEIREPFLSDLIEERERRLAVGRGRLATAWWTAWELAAGAAQHLRLPGARGAAASTR